MTGTGTAHVALIPPESLETSLIKQVAAILNKDLYEIRLLLSGNIPKVVAHFDSVLTAESAATTLRLLGLKAYSFVDKELQKPQSSTTEFIAHSVSFEEERVRFSSRSGVSKIIGAEDLFLILFGKMHLTTATKEVQTRMKFSIPATLMTGGIPVWRRSEVSIEGRSIRNEYFIWLYDWLSQEPEIQIFESDFNYAFLGKKIAPSTLKNLELLLEEIKKKFRKAIFDNRLVECVPVIEQNKMANVCRLINLYHRAELN